MIIIYILSSSYDEDNSFQSTSFCQSEENSLLIMRALRTMNVAKRIATQTIHHHHTPYIFAARHLDVKVVSAKDNAQNSRQLEASRPISPHFTIYKWPFAGLASGTQRVTGFALVLGIFTYISIYQYLIFQFCEIAIYLVLNI